MGSGKVWRLGKREGGCGNDHSHTSFLLKRDYIRKREQGGEVGMTCGLRWRSTI